MIPGDPDEARYAIETELVSIGSSPQNSISLHHRSVSPRHCRLEKRNDALWLVAIGDAETLVNDRVVSEVRLRPEDQIRVGELTLSFEICEAGTSEVLSHTFRRDTFGDVFLQELKRAPWMLTSVGVHALLLYVLWELPFFQRLHSAPTPPIQAGLAQFDPDELVDPKPLDETELEMETPEQNIPEPVLEESIREIVEMPRLDLADARGLEEFSGTGAGGGPLLGQGSDRLLTSGSDAGFGDRVQDLRRRGVEIVFVFDSTSSMTDVLTDVKRSLDRMITILTWIVPHARLGVVTFRDHGDDYLARSLPLTGSRYRILTWVDRIQAAGGGDIPEAVFEGLGAAFEEMPWTEGAQQVVVLIGDAPPHSQSMKQIDEIVARFRRRAGRGADNLVSTVFTGKSDSGSRDDLETITAFQRIASRGGGSAVTLSDENQITQQCLTLAFGHVYRDDIDRIFAQLQEGGRAQLLKRRLQRGAQEDIDWLLAKLHRAPVHPGVVNGLLLFHRRYPKISDELLRNLRRSDVGEESRWASLYLLRRIFDHDFDFDPAASRYDQQRQIQSISSVIDASRRRGPLRRRR